MDRRRFVVLLGGALAAPQAFAQSPARIPRIGYLLQPALMEPPTQERQAFLDGLRALGYVPGKNLEIVYRSAENEMDFLDEVARELVARKPDVIVTSGAAAALSAKKATQTVPIVMMGVGDPVGIGLVRSLARPGGNATGVSFLSRDLAPKRVQMLQEMLPDAKLVAVLWDKRNPNARQESAATAAVMRTVGMNPVLLGIDEDRQLEPALEGAVRRKVQALYVVFEGSLVGFNRTMLAEYGLRQRIAVVSGWTSLADAGGLFSYGPVMPEMYRRAAAYVHRVLQGEKPENLPVEQPTRIELVVNLKTAAAIGVRVPPALRLRADRVIE